jgi:glycosyltransferase involved in cell wall biosynthesis
LDLPGRKVIVGDGPYLDQLRRTYPETIFTGFLTGEDLAEAYASADVFVFPSVTDTFGLVIIEALASGLPVAAYPVTGPVDLITGGVHGALDRDLKAAILRAQSIPSGNAREHGLKFSWQRTAALFINNIEAAHRRAGIAAKSGATRRGASARPVAYRPAHS